MNSLKVKLIIWFILGGLLSGAAIYYVYTSFGSLSNSMKVLAEPDRSYKLVDAVKNDLVKTENSMRSYMMSGKLEFLDDYLEGMDRIGYNLDSLSYFNKAQENEQTIDEIEELLATRADLMYDLVDLKNRSNSDGIADKSFKQFKEEISENETNLSSKTPKADSIDENDMHVLKPPTAYIDPAEQGKSKLKGLFRKKQDTTSVNLSELYNVQLESDSANLNSEGSDYIINYNADINLEKIRQILNEINKEEKRYNARLNKRELEILTSDRLIMAKVNDIMTSVEVINELQYLNAKNRAESQVTKTSKNIFVIAILALIIGLLLLVALMRDINKRQRYRKELEISKEYAESLANARQRFLANMSHEIRTPLNAIIGFSEQLDTDFKHEREELQHIRKASGHLLGIVNDILDYSKMELGNIQLNKNRMVIAELVKDVTDLLKEKSSSKNLSIVIDIDDACNKPVIGDELRLRQVLFNLIGNAIKFTDSGTISVIVNSKIKKKYTDYTIKIVDSGIGIPKEKLGNIFNDFSQADDTIERSYGGTGLGLAISKKIVEKQGGDISVESELGKGTTFTIELRYAHLEDSTITPDTPEDVVIKDLKDLKILVVDDEPFNLQLAKTILLKAKSHVETSSSSTEALGLINSNKYETYLIDLHMPGIGGVELANVIRHNNSKATIIALTADVITPEADLVTNGPFDDVMYKPYKANELINACKGKNVMTERNPVDVEGDELFSFEEIRKFADDDEMVVQEILEQFLRSTEQNLSRLQSAAQYHNLQEVKETAHKMLPSFQHLNIKRCIKPLKELEGEKLIAPSDILKTIEFIVHHTNEVMDELQKHINTVAK